MLRQSFKVTVDQGVSAIGKRFIVGIDPVPVMRWYDVVNAREELKLVIQQSAGKEDRRNAILGGVLAQLRVWSDRGILFPFNWADGDEYTCLMSVLPEP